MVWAILATRLFVKLLYVLSVYAEAHISILVFNVRSFFKQHPQWKESTAIHVLPIRSIRAMHAAGSADLFIWGGGGIIRNRPIWLKRYLLPLRVAQFFGRKIFICSIGVDVISSPEVLKLLQKIKPPRHFSVRDNQSRANFLQANGNFSSEEVHVVRDPVFHFKEMQRTGGLQKRIGFDITYWKADFSDQKAVERFVDSYSRLLVALRDKTGATLVYLPTVPERDGVMYEALARRITRIECPTVNTSEQYTNHLSRLDLFIGMRMHALIVASSVQGLPVTGIVYDEKVETLRVEGGFKGLVRIEDVADHPEAVALEMLSAQPQETNFLRQNSLALPEIIRSL